MNTLIQFSLEYGPTIKAVYPWVLGSIGVGTVALTTNIPKYFGKKH